jgi:hypothetical protein
MKIKGILALIMSGMLLLGGPTGTAVARDFTDSTTLSLNASPRHVDKGDSVSFSGHLRADHKKCRVHRTIKLFRNGVKVAQTLTDSNGFYRFVRNIFRTANWQTRFSGAVGGTHPHSFTCLASRSRTVTVSVNN